MKKNVIGLTFVLLSLFIFGCKVDVNNSDTDPVKTEKLISRPSGIQLFKTSRGSQLQKLATRPSGIPILKTPRVYQPQNLGSRPSGFDIFTISLVCGTQKAPLYTSENKVL